MCLFVCLSVCRDGGESDAALTAVIDQTLGALLRVHLSTVRPFFSCSVVAVLM